MTGPETAVSYLADSRTRTYSAASSDAPSVRTQVTRLDSSLRHERDRRRRPVPTKDVAASQRHVGAHHFWCRCSCSPGNGERTTSDTQASIGGIPVHMHNWNCLRLTHSTDVASALEVSVTDTPRTV